MYTNGIHLERKGVLCISVCSNTVEQVSESCICVRIRKKCTNWNVDLDIENPQTIEFPNRILMNKFYFAQHLACLGSFV